ncbi:hypothetical protein CONLIGDRAFT_563029, partial [Coniochaeta ligniaria NRRL 30616]
SKKGWEPGQLIGPGGAEKANIAKSPSLRPQSQCLDPIEEERSVTSTGHVPQYRRPPSACVGWGGYDRFSSYMSYGRQIPASAIKPEKWPTDSWGEVRFVDSSGKVVKTL